jgi:hypothetical protein
MAQIERVVAYYDKADEEYVSEYLVDIDIETIRSLWEAQEYDAQYQQMYPIEEKQRAAIEEILGEPLELDKYDYFLESHNI